MRAFISMDLDKEAKKEVLNLQKELEKSKLVKGKLTEQENLHLTLKFLGDVDEKKAEEVKKLLRQIKFRKFNSELETIGTFGDRDVRIIWVKLGGEDVLELQKQIDEQLKNLFKKEFRFMSHVTIMRIKEAPEQKQLNEYLKKLNFKKIKFSVNEFVLNKSTLTKKGPIYEVLEKYKLI